MTEHRSQEDYQVGSSQPPTTNNEQASDTALHYGEPHRLFSETFNHPFPEAHHPPNELGPEAYRVGSEEKEAVQHQAYQQDQRGTGSADSAARRICGLQLKAFIIAAVTVVTIVAAIVGGVVGGVVAPRQLTPAESASPTPSSGPAEPTSSILAATRLGAAWWNDERGREVHMIYWQDSDQHIMLSQWNFTKNTWDVLNVSGSVRRGTGQQTTPRASTDLIPMVIQNPHNLLGVEAHLYFLTEDHTPSMVWKQANDGTEWKLEGLQASVSVTSRRFTPGSHLAVYEDYCDGPCSDNTFVLAQDESHNITQFVREAPNTDNWAYSGALMGVVPPSDLSPGLNGSVTLSRGSSPGGFGRDGLRLFVDQGGEMYEYLFNNSQLTRQGQSWPLDEGNQGVYHAPDIAAIEYRPPNNGLLELVIFTILYPDGSAVVWWLPRDGVWDTGTITGLERGVTALAMHSGLKGYAAYGTSGIKEYAISRNRPSTWTYVRDVGIRL